MCVSFHILHLKTNSNTNSLEVSMFLVICTDKVLFSMYLSLLSWIEMMSIVYNLKRLEYSQYMRKKFGQVIVQEVLNIIYKKSFRKFSFPVLLATKERPVSFFHICMILRELNNSQPNNSLVFTHPAFLRIFRTIPSIPFLLMLYFVSHKKFVQGSSPNFASNIKRI